MLSGCIFLLSWAFPATAEPAPERPSCSPTLIPDGLTDKPSNNAGAPLILKPSCINDTTITPEGITINGLNDGHNAFTVVATDRHGQILMGNFMLPVGGNNTPHSVVEEYEGILSRTNLSPCTKCSGCDACPASPMCQPSCQNPDFGSCDFYTTCAEASLHCGPSGYPIRYGDKICNHFKSRMGAFSDQGQRWINTTMSCLQKALIGPLTDCGATCDGITAAAFDSHAPCYANSGVCDLPLGDLLQLVITLNTDLFVGPAMQQILSTVKGCAAHFIGGIEAGVLELKQSIIKDKRYAQDHLAKVVILEGVKKQLLK
ncbi:hypothetical protein J3459_016595 [Metarhizium acridum]|nr:hypothetical protein J3459_016595 [Metarhizium acridum]